MRPWHIDEVVGRVFRFGRVSIPPPLAVVLLVACGSAEPKHVECRPGEVRTCAIAGCTAATERCGGSPLAWGACACDDLPDAGPVPISGIGRACSTDGECPTGAFCLDPSSTALSGGAPPEGVCVADCMGAPLVCQAFAGAVCVATGDDSGPALCFEACTPGQASSAPCTSAVAACEALGEGSEGFCRPLCTTDADCSEPRVCDPRTSVCVDTVTSGPRSLGEACDPEAPSCAGLCLELDASHAICSTRCVFGTSANCANEPGRQAGCLFSQPSGGVGDIGYCAELCDCPQDCGGADLVCDPFDDETLESAFGKLGVCTPVDAALNVPLVCP